MESHPAIASVSPAPSGAEASPPRRSGTGGATGDLWEPPRFDRELVRKYDVPAPRYTSYPTAPCFDDDFGPGGYRELLDSSASSDVPLSLYVHIPFCKTRCFFCGCNVTIARDPDRARAYLESLAREVEAVGARLGGDRRRVVQIHWGGGTPNFLPPREIGGLGRLLRRVFDTDDDCEFGVEIDPRRCDDAQLDALADIGVNRLSVGIQDVDPEVQRAINRVQPMDRTRAVIEGGRARGMESVNVDLIYGLPHQTPERFGDTVERVLELGPDRLAVFNFAYLPSILPHQTVIDADALPSPEDKLTILEEVIERVVGAGYVFIGLDHFAKPEDPLAQALRERTLTRNFQGYSTWAGVDLVGFGSSAIGQLAGGYAQNERLVGPYQKAIADGGLATCRGMRLSPEDELRRDVILRLMCHFRLDLDAVSAAWDVDARSHFADELGRLEPLADDGLVTRRDGVVDVTPLGRLLVRNVAAVFDEYLPKQQGTFSRTV